MKEKIDKLIINGYVLTMDNKGTIIKNGEIRFLTLIKPVK